MLRRLMGLTALTAFAALAAAGPQSYASRTQSVRAGIVILENAKPALLAQPVSSAPHALYNVSANRLVKPAGWNFFNPYAPSVATDEIVQRWNSITGGVGVPAVNTAVTKRHAAYWEVFLNRTSDETLGSYDLLVVNPLHFASLTSLERDRLRRFVDSGGILLVDPWGAQMDQVNGFPVPFRVNPGQTGSTPEQSDFTQPVLNVPNLLTRREVSYVNLSVGGPGNGTLQPIDLSLESAGALQPMYGGLIWDFNSIRPVTFSGGGLTFGYARIGDGFVVVSSRGMTAKLNRVAQSGASYTANRGYEALPPELEADGLAAAKLLVNVVTMASNYRQTGGGSRKSSSSFVDVEAPLLQRFRAEDVPLGGGAASIPPVVYKGVLLMSVGNQVHAFDASPSEDLDGDGNIDDGMADLNFGLQRDRLWISPALPGAISGPVAAEIPDANVKDQVLVTDSAGGLHILNFFTGAIVASIPAPTASTVPAGEAPIPPTVHGAFAFVADNVQQGLSLNGRVWLADLRLGAAMTSIAPWSVGGAPTDVLPWITWSPTVGYVPITDNSGGADRVIYVPTRGQGLPPNNTPGFISIWLGARGERPFATDVIAGGLQVTTRAATAGGLNVYNPGSSTAVGTHGIKLTLIDNNGNPLSANRMAQIFSGAISQAAGVVTFPFATGVTALPADVDEDRGVRIDYTIDWGIGTPGLTQAIERGRINFPDVTGAKRVLGSLALSPRGTIYAVVANPAPAGGGPTDGGLGSYYALREEPRGNFKMISRWDLYNRHRITLNQTTPVTYREVLEDNDSIRQFLPPALSGGILSRFEFAGPPSVRNGLVYVTARAVLSNVVPVSMLLVFDAEPQTAEINVGELPNNFAIVQPDMAKSTNIGQDMAPGSMSILRPGDYTYDRSKGRIRFESLMRGTRGQVQDSLSTSQPVIIRVPSQPDRIVEPEASGTRWNPLRWYVTSLGTKVVGGPVTTGGTTFMTGQSAVPDVIQFGTFTNTRGLMFAMASDVSPNDKFLIPTPGRPWLKQSRTFIVTATGIDPNPNIKWPQLKGVQSFDDWKIRLFEATMGNSSTSFGLIAGDGTVGAWSDVGLYAFTRADFLVADEGRVVQFDPAGNPVWSTNASATSGPTGGGFAASVNPIVRPTRAYRVGLGDVLAVDTGGNRIVQFDKTGIETRSIGQFITDPVPANSGNYGGFKSSDSPVFKSPRDVLTYTEYVTLGGTAIVSNQQPLEYWVHYLVADSGNKRLVELIDRYAADPATRRVGNPVVANGAPQLGVLWWHSPASVTGKNFDYVGVNRVWLPDASGGRYVYVAGIGNTMPSRVDTGLDAPTRPDPANPVYTDIREAGDGSGGVVVFDPASQNGVVVVNRINLPDMTQARLYYEASEMAPYGAAAGWYTLAELPAAAQQQFGPALQARTKALSGVNSVTAQVVNDSGVPAGAYVAITIADSTGVYEVRQNAGATWDVRWMLPNRAFRSMRRSGVLGPPSGSNAQLRAMYAKRLDSGEMLLVNGYYGRDRANREFTGEVLQVDGSLDLSGAPNDLALGYSPLKTNFGFNAPSVKYELPPVQGIRGLILPVFADRK